MKKNHQINISVVVVIIMLLNVSNGYAQQDSDSLHYKLSVCDILSNNNGSSQRNAIPSKENRLNAYTGCIHYSFAPEFPKEYEQNIQLAVQIWSSVLYNTNDIYLRFSTEPAPISDPNQEYDVYTEINYIMVDGTNVSLPSALYRQNYDVQNSKEPDATIYISTTSDWDLNFANKTDLSKNLCYMAMRSIAYGLGFGASIENVMRRGNLETRFRYRRYSPFDKLIISQNGDSLIDYLNESSDNIRNFARGNQGVVYASKINATYELYTPDQYDDAYSLKTLTDQQSLMRANPVVGTDTYSIDQTTVELLNLTGWKIKHPTDVYKIRCSDISDNGIGVINKYYNFCLNVQDSAPDSFHINSWVCKVLTQSGEYIEVKRQNGGEDFRLKVELNPVYNLNIDGDVSAIIEVSYSIFGADYLSTMKLSLETQPEITSITPLHSDPQPGQGKYTAKYLIKYRGADRLTIYQEDEYSPVIDKYTVFAPFEAIVSIPNIYSAFYNWITIEVSNSYGSVSKEITLEPIVFNKAIPKVENGIDTSILHTIKSINIYNISGELIIPNAALSDISGLPSGVYLKQIIYSDNNYKTTKLIK